MEVWYDEFSLRPGDSLRRSIDIGLSRSRYGVVVLSPSFFEKGWPQWELDGLIQRQNRAQDTFILPIWHNVTHEEVASFSPSLADKYAIPTSLGIERVAAKLLEVLHPEGSTLLIARDMLLDFGCDPPVVTDDWWLEVVEASAANPLEGTFQDPMGWGRWGFPLPPKGESPRERGERLAWAAMQMVWQERAKTKRISQVTHPDQVLEFIDSQPGLGDACEDNLAYLVSYAPQLSIRGFAGEFEEAIEYRYSHSVSENTRRRNAADRFGTGLTTNGLAPACDESMALRHPQFGDYRPANVACWFVQGELMGPEVKFYETVDYVAWFLSDQSKWMPEASRYYLIEGLKDWGVWPWEQRGSYARDFGFQPGSTTGSLFEALCKARSSRSFRLTRACREDLETRLEFSCKLLGLLESASTVADRFLEHGFIEAWFKKSERFRAKRGQRRRGTQS